MRLHLIRPLVLLLMASASVIAESLPQWKDEDYARLRRGEIIAGVDILVEDKEVMASLKSILAGEVLPILPEELELAYDPKVVPDEFLRRYFTRSEDHLVDPQKLLTKQEYVDRKEFLDYHAENSNLKVKMYLFDADQNLPSTHTIEKICEKLYADEPLTAVIYCFLGNPNRNQLAFTGGGSIEVSPSDRRGVLEEARIKAMEKSDPVMQLESFIVQLSIGLFWLETDLAKVMASIAAEESRVLAGKAWQSGDDVGEVKVIALSGGVVEMVKGQLHWIILGLVALACMVVACVFGWCIWKKSKCYYLPVIETPERLGASYAAGVGAVLIFHKKLGSPSKQRNQIPDYLRRI